MLELWRLSAHELAEGIREHRYSAREVIEAHLQRIEDVNPRVNAVAVVMIDEARRAAAEADERQERGEQLGPLHGVPVTVKESYDVAGTATTRGVAAFADNIAPADCPIVESLRDAGAIVIGRTNLPDFATRLHTESGLHGATVNPWGAELSPGGSTGGDAAAVATGMAPIGIGGDSGGSLRVPASACGITSLRTTPGVVPEASSLPGPPPSMAIQLFSSSGPVARRVNDLQVALSVIRRGSPRDPNWIPAALEPRGVSGTRVAVTTDPCGLGVDAEVAQSVRRAADALESAGYHVTEVDPPMVLEAQKAFESIVPVEIRLLMFDTIKRLGSAGVVRFVEGLLEIGPELDLREYAQALADRMTLCGAWTLFCDTYPIVLGPVSTELTWPAGYDQGGVDHIRRMLDSYGLTLAANVLAAPAVTVPSSKSRSGAPIGVQLLGPRFSDATLLEAARFIEEKIAPITPIDPL